MIQRLTVFLLLTVTVGLLALQCESLYATARLAEAKMFWVRVRGSDDCGDEAVRRYAQAKLDEAVERSMHDAAVLRSDHNEVVVHVMDGLFRLFWFEHVPPARYDYDAFRDMVDLKFANRSNASQFLDPGIVVPRRDQFRIMRIPLTTVKWRQPLSMKNRRQRWSVVRLPLWSLVLPCIVYPTLVLARNAHRRWRKRRGLCICCGYDLTHNTSGVCPECGSKTANE